MCRYAGPAWRRTDRQEQSGGASARKFAVHFRRIQRAGDEGYRNDRHGREGAGEGDIVVQGRTFRNFFFLGRYAHVPNLHMSMYNSTYGHCIFQAPGSRHPAPRAVPHVVHRALLVTHHPHSPFSCTCIVLQVVLNDFYEWRFAPLLVPPPTLQEDMRRLVNNRELSDVKFIVDGFPVYARYILTVHCYYC